MSILSFDLRASLRRLKPEKNVATLKRRDDAELPFVGGPVGVGAPLLLDTTVYIDTLQDRLPDAVAELIRLRQPEHSSLAVAELAHAYGRLEPSHAGTADVLRTIRSVIDAIPQHRLGEPSVRATIEAGILSGTLARARRLPKTQPGLLVDAILFLQAVESGCHLLSRKIGDMDLLLQIFPAGRVLLYRQTSGVGSQIPEPPVAPARL